MISKPKLSLALYRAIADEATCCLSKLLFYMFEVGITGCYYLTEVSKTRQYRIPPLLLVNRTFPAGFP